MALVILISALMGLIETATQYREANYVRSVANDVVKKAQASGPRLRIIALRDYLRSHVSFDGAPVDDRPFFRASAADTLRTGEGYCGEATRAFICMADALGIRSQRINLWGETPHVVAEAELGSGERVLVDCQNPPQIADLETLDQVMIRPGYDDYYTLNLRRLHLSSVLSRVKLQLGPLTYWTENPHALKAMLWFLLAITLLGMVEAVRAARTFARFYLRKHRWIHASNADAIRAASMYLTNESIISGPTIDRDSDWRSSKSGRSRMKWLHWRDRHRSKSL